MRADLHVHSAFSGARHYRRAGLRDAYASPGEIYDRARAAGMDLVTITDRETIEGCLRLIDERGDLPDFVIGEEVEASLPGTSLRVHLNVWGIDETRHAEIQRLRHDAGDLTGWLRASRIAYCFNHFVGSLPVDLPSARIYLDALSLFDALEVRNGMQGRRYNELIASIAAGEAERRRPLAFIGGSDAHTLRRVGTTMTEAVASSTEAFLEEILAGRTAAGGRVSSAADVLLDPASLIAEHYRRLARSLGGDDGAGGRGPILSALGALPLQALGAPLVGTAVYFVRVRAQVRALEREIAAMDLRSFRDRMRSFPRDSSDVASHGS